MGREQFWKGWSSLSVPRWRCVPLQSFRAGYPLFTERGLLERAAQDEAGISNRIAPFLYSTASQGPFLHLLLLLCLCALVTGSAQSHTFVGSCYSLYWKLKRFCLWGRGGRRLLVTGSCLVLSFACPGEKFANTGHKTFK